MADPGATTTALTRSDPDLLVRMLSQAWRFDFFQLVWLLQRHRPDAEAVGYRGPVSREAFRFRPHVSLGFPPSDVRRVIPVKPKGGRDLVYVLEATFLGLYGVATPLPLHYAIDILRAVDPYNGGPADQLEQRPVDQLAVAEEDLEPTPTRDFLDLLHHRLISLFYRSWTKYRYHTTFGMPNHDEITAYLLWLIGGKPGWDRATVGVSPVRLLRYAGILTQHPRSAATLEGMLFDYWRGIPVEVEQFVGRWVPLKTSDLNRMGLANSRLGVDLTVGEQVYDLCGAFNIAFGPVDWATYLRFLPDGACYAETRSLVRLYCTDPLSFSLEIRLKAGEVPEMQLSSDDEAGRLGYTSWVRTDEMPETSVAFGVN